MIRGCGVWSGLVGEGETRGEGERTGRERKPPGGKMECEHMARGNSKCLGYLTGEAARLGVRRVD